MLHGQSLRKAPVLSNNLPSSWGRRTHRTLLVGRGGCGAKGKERPSLDECTVRFATAFEAISRKVKPTRSVFQGPE